MSHAASRIAHSLATDSNPSLAAIRPDRFRVDFLDGTSLPSRFHGSCELRPTFCGKQPRQFLYSGEGQSGIKPMNAVHLFRATEGFLVGVPQPVAYSCKPLRLLEFSLVLTKSSLSEPAPSNIAQ